MNDTLTSAASVRARRVAASLATVAGVCGVFTLVGWGFELRRLADWDLDNVAQMPNNAIGVVAAAAALVCAVFGRITAARVLGAFAALLALATLFEHATSIDLGIDTLVLYREWGQTGTVSPGRMGLPGSGTLAVLGASIILGTFPRTRTLAPAGGLVIIAIAMLSLIGYIFGADRLYAIPRLTTIALQTSTMMLILGAAVVASVPERGLMKLMVADSAAGVLVRRALPVIVVLPTFLGWARVKGQDATLFDTAFGTAMLVLTLIALLTALLWRGAMTVSVHEEALRHGRDRMAAILGSITDAFVTVDAQWRFVFINHAVEEVFGRSREELDTLSLWDVMGPAAGDGVHGHLVQAMRDRVTVDFEAFYPARNRWLAHRAYPTAGGGLAIYSRDVSEQKAAEEALRRSTEALRAADRMKDEFLATLSHELRTPLTAIIGWSEILLRADLEPNERAIALETIRSSARAQAQLVDDVLDVSRIVTGKLRLHRTESELVSIVQAAVDTVRPAAEGKRITLGLNLDYTLPPMLVDPERIRQVVWNILSNAIKFSAEGTSVEVTLSAEGESAVVTVSDQGRGIPRAFLPHVFERFRQADSSSTRAHTGLGLGLALAKDLVELHGGSISVESEENVGSRFTVRLPLGPAASAQSAENTPRVAIAPVRPPLDGVRVLYVDDREDARLLIGTMLRQQGAVVSAAGTVNDALIVLSTHRPHVVVTDLAMPDRDGYDLLAAIRSDRQWDTLPVLALTAQARVGDETHAVAAGFYRFLRKPVESVELGAAVARAVAETAAGS
jgi:PAS domain S-box-containing protein